jgi:hypothetical protein
VHNKLDLESPLLLSNREPKAGHFGFRVLWWLVNACAIAALFAVLYSGAWEYSVRRYLKGFSDAIIPASATPEQKVEAILLWMRNGPPRPVAENVDGLNPRNPEVTLNYEQLLKVCGTATNAFLNLSRSSGLSARRLLLLSPEHQAKHVVAEVLLDGRWIVVDPTYRIFMRSRDGRSLTREDLRTPALFAEATGIVPGYPQNYTYESYAHVRLSRLPLEGLGLRKILNRMVPGWEEAADWSLLLERESFFVLCASLAALVFFVLFRTVLAWYADFRLLAPRFRLREHVWQAGVAFLSAPGMKQ